MFNLRLEFFGDAVASQTLRLLTVAHVGTKVGFLLGLSVESDPSLLKRRVLVLVYSDHGF